MTDIDHQYFIDDSYTPRALLRRIPGRLDEAWVGGEWRRTSSIIEWMAGRNDFVTPCDEIEAIKFAPEAHRS